MQIHKEKTIFPLQEAALIVDEVKQNGEKFNPSILLFVHASFPSGWQLELSGWHSDPLVSPLTLLAGFSE